MERVSCPVFRPAPWIPGAHAQTVLGSLLPTPVPDLPWEPFPLSLGDGDQLWVNLLRGDPGRVLHLFHGLGGSAQAGYVLRLARRMHARGWTVLAANHRGAGKGRGLAARPYHSGATNDLSQVLAHGRQLYPEGRHLAVGYSISGNVLLLLLGRQQSGATLPDGAVAVNPPCDLDRCSRALQMGFNRVYDRRFVRLLVEEVNARASAGLIDPVDFGGVKTLRDFDEAYTARAAGFRDRSHYYAECGCGPHLVGISRPTVILTSEDDPIAPASELRRFDCPPMVDLQIQGKGGHMGYLARRTEQVPDGRWLEVALAHHLEHLLADLEGRGPR